MKTAWMQGSARETLHVPVVYFKNIVTVTISHHYLYRFGPSGDMEKEWWIVSFPEEPAISL